MTDFDGKSTACNFNKLTTRSKLKGSLQVLYVCTVSLICTKPSATPWKSCLHIIRLIVDFQQKHGWARLHQQFSVRPPDQTLALYFLSGRVVALLQSSQLHLPSSKFYLIITPPLNTRPLFLAELQFCVSQFADQ